MARYIEDLEKYGNLKQEVLELKDRIATLKSIAERATPGYGLSAASSGAGQTKEDIQIEAMELKEKLDIKTLQLEKKCQDIEKYTDRLTVDEQRVIKARYLTGKKKTWTVVSMAVHMSRSQCFEYHNRAIEKLWRWGLR